MSLMHVFELRCFQIPEIRFFFPSNREHGDIASFDTFPTLEAELCARAQSCWGPVLPRGGGPERGPTELPGTPGAPGRRLWRNRRVLETLSWSSGF